MCVKLIDNHRRDGLDEVPFRRLTVCLVVCSLGGAIAPVAAGASVDASEARTHEYRLPTDGWKIGHSREGFGGPFHAALTKSGACAWIASYDVVWPAGYRVRFHPTELVGPTGKVVARHGEDVSIAGQLVGTASWPQASRCYKGGDLVAAQSPVLAGRDVFLPFESPGAVVTHQSPLPAHRLVPRTSGSAVCGKGIVHLGPDHASESATLLPCYKLNLPTGVRRVSPWRSVSFRRARVPHLPPCAGPAATLRHHGACG
jgi:hypothetical protein